MVDFDHGLCRRIFGADDRSCHPQNIVILFFPVVSFCYFLFVCFALLFFVLCLYYSFQEVVFIRGQLWSTKVGFFRFINIEYGWTG